MFSRVYEQISARAARNPRTTRCEGEETDFPPTSSPPPSVAGVETVQDKMWSKFKTQPLVPIGCMVTAYFLASGLRSFTKRDPVRSQRMMRNRVMAQFATLIAFIGYMGMDQADWRLAPMYQDKHKKKEESSPAADN